MRYLRMPESKSTAEIDRYDPNIVLVCRGQPGRYAFKHVYAEGKRVLLQHVSKNGKRYGSIHVSAAAFERTFFPAFTDQQRQHLRIHMLVTLFKTESLPKGYTDQQLESAMKWLIKGNFVDKDYELTEKGRKIAEGLTQNDSKAS